MDALDNQKRVMASSDIGTIILNSIYTLIAPKIEAANKTISYYFQKGMAKFMKFSWLTTQEESLNYEVQIASDSKFKNLVKSTVTSNNKMFLNQELPAGEYYWRVRSRTPAAVSGWSDTAQFKVYLGQTN